MALNKDRIFKAARKHIGANRIEKAIAEYETWLKENRRDWNTIRIVGDLYARIGRNDEGIKKYSQVAEHYRSDGFNVRAIATHKMILRLDPQNESTMRNLAELQAEEGLLMEAKSYYQQLLELYNKRGQKREAADVFRKLAAIDPQDVKIRYKYAEFLSKQGKADEAAAEYVGIADQFIGQGLVEEAVKILQQGRSLATSGPTLKLKLAEAHSLQGKHAEAVAMLEEVQRASPHDAEILAQLGEAFMAAGRTADAETSFQKLVEADSENPKNVLRLAELRIVQSKFDDALVQLIPLVDRNVADGEGEAAAELLRKVLAKDPGHVKTLLKLAEVHTVLKNEPARVKAYDGLCEAYAQAGDYEKAVQVAEQLVELDPETSQHVDRLKFLKSKLEAETAAPGSPAPSAPHASAPQVRADQDLPELTGIEEIGLEEEGAEGFDRGLSAEASGASGPAPSAVDLGDVVALTEEDEENVKEKLTEAEVFVRYGLVDKAIAQLLDVLESFRFHVESREKLIEIYRDQDMTSEAAQQLMHLAQVRGKLGQSEAANAAREEAVQLDPALASRAMTAEPGYEEEIELTLAPDSELESDLGDVGLELERGGDAAVEDVDGEEEIPLALDEASFEVEAAVEEENEIDLSLGDDADVLETGGEEAGAGAEKTMNDVSFEIDLGEAAADASQPAIAGEDEGDEPPGLEEIAAPTGAEEMAFEDADDDAEIAIDLDASEDVSFALDEEASEPLFTDGPASREPGGSPGGSFDAKASVPAFEEAAPDENVEDQAEEFFVALDDQDEIAADLPSDALPSEPGEDELLAPSLGDVEEGAEDDIEIDIPAVGADAGDEGELDVPRSVSEASPPEPAPASAELSTPAPRYAPPGGADRPFAAGLAEVDEYIALGLYEDARDTLRDLLKQHPGEASVLAKIEELGFSAEQLQKAQPGPASAEPPASPPGVATDAREERPRHVGTERPSPPPSASEPVEAPALAEAGGEDELGLESLVGAVPETGDAGGGGSAEESFIDLASELSEDLFGTQSAVEEEGGGDEAERALTDPGLDQMFREFRKGVEKQLGTEDYDTRYNLGIAYKEMGLLDEAVAEFQLAAKDEVRGLECCSMLGLCFMEKGMPDIAIKWFAKGLALPGRREEEYHGLRYDLAQAHEAAGQADRALELYTEIFKDNARFRDVKDRVRELQAARK